MFLKIVSPGDTSIIECNRIIKGEQWVVAERDHGYPVQFAGDKCLTFFVMNDRGDTIDKYEGWLADGQG